MKPKTKKAVLQEYDFALVLGGLAALTTEVEDALYEAGCDDATLSLQYGLVYAEFSRRGESLQAALLSALRDVRKAGVGAQVLRVDECDLVTPAEIARRIKRSRQLVAQYINGQRGPGHFPPPECHLTEGAPLWSWCTVSAWLAEHGIIRAEAGKHAQVVAALNTLLEAAQQRQRNPQLVKQINAELSLSA